VIGIPLGLFFCLKGLFLEGPFDVAIFIYSEEGFFVFLGLGFVLLLALLCVVKVCYFRKGSLRPFVVYV